MKRLTAFLLIVFLSNICIAGNKPAKPKVVMADLKPEKVLSIAEDYINNRKIDISDYQMVSLRYSFDLDFWLVVYENPNNLTIGGGHFSLYISDKKDPDVKLQPGY